MFFKVALNHPAVRNERGPISLVLKRSRHQMFDIALVKDNVSLVGRHNGSNITVVISGIGVNADPVLGNPGTDVVPWSGRLPVIPNPICVVVLKLHPRLHETEPSFRPFPVEAFPRGVIH